MAGTHRGRFPIRGAMLVGLALASTPAFAQDSPADDPELTDPTVEEMMESLERRSREPVRLRPTQDPVSVPVRPGLPPDVRQVPGFDQVAGGRRLPEGTFLSRQPATLAIAPTGERAVVFADPGDPEFQRVMYLMPSPMLDRIEAMTEAYGPDVLLTVSGEVFVYHRRNYLLPTAVGRVPTNAIARAMRIERGELEDVETRLLDDPDVQSLIEDMEASADAPRAIAHTPQTEAFELDEVAPPMEGSLLTRRRGRLVRLGGGEWAFAIDNSFAALGHETDLMVLLPSTTLMRLERTVASGGDTVVLEMSGRMFMHGGRAFLLPTAFHKEQVDPGGISSMH